MGGDFYALLLCLLIFLGGCFFINLLIEVQCGVEDKFYPFSRSFFFFNPLIYVIYVNNLIWLFKKTHYFFGEVLIVLLYSLIVFIISVYFFLGDLKRIKSILYILFFQSFLAIIFLL